MPSGRYNLRPRVDISYLTPKHIRKAVTNRNPHLDIKVGEKRIYYRKKVTNTTINQPSPPLRPFTKAAGHEHWHHRPGSVGKKKKERRGRGHSGEHGVYVARKKGMGKRERMGGSGLKNVRAAGV